MLLMVEKGIRGEICHAIHRYVKANNKYMKYYKTKKNRHWDVNILYGWAMSQKLPVYEFKWVEDVPEFNEDFTKSYSDEIDEGYFLEVDVQYPEKP